LSRRSFSCSLFKLLDLQGAVRARFQGEVLRLIFLLLLFVGLSCAGALAEVPPEPGDAARCQVCGMFVAPHTQWVAVLELADGRVYYFDGPKDLFTCFSNLSTYLPGASQTGAKLYVTDYYTLTVVPAAAAFFIEGSDVLGPMGQEKVPVVGREAAVTFLRDHGGTGLKLFDGQDLVAAPESP